MAAASSPELQFVIFNYLLAQADEARELYEASREDESKVADFELVFEEVMLKRDELVANIFAICAQPPHEDPSVLSVCKEQFATYETKNNCGYTTHSDCSQRLGIPTAVLPPLPLPVFSGNRAVWIGLAELFNSIVGQAPHLTQVQKIHYLLGCSQGESRELVHNIPVTENNYSVIWKILEKGFKSLRLAVTLHVQKILHLQKVDILEENLSALEAQKFLMGQWDFLLLNILLEKLDAPLRQVFELSHEEDVPSYSKLLKFLERKARAVEHVQLAADDQPPARYTCKSPPSQRKFFS
ncbi:hypothetical protein PR048_030875 [Dryococelus australis]|uniref:Uncharacterized protein n=1 Tax=Dryococelus australis TaxID=614101 RepID=A0ABQ9GA86_9NEOP|nr:hypothetical protein PR048_030875 [Dryococelus australis]